MYLYSMICCVISFNFVSSNNQNILERLVELERRLDDIDSVEKENVHLKSQLNELETKYNKKFKEMERRLNKCDKRGAKLENMLHERFDTLEWIHSSQYDDVKSQLGTILKEQFYNATTDSNYLKTKQNSESEKITQELPLEKKRPQPNFRNTHLDGLKSTLAKKRHQKREANVSTVAFTATLSRDLNNLSNGHMIPFPNVRLNEGNAFTGFDGIFICPQSGLYLFSYNIFSTKHSGVQFKVNNNPYIETYIVPANGLTINGGATFVVRLNVGDHVWMTSDMDETRLLATKTYFMGVLLFT